MKKILEDNKIYFELLSSVMFGAAALFISIASYNISKEQLDAEMLANKPHFYIETEQRKDSSTGLYANRVLKIYNAGAPVYNLEVSHNEFVEVRLFDDKLDSVYVPVIGYYPFKFPTHSPVGLIAAFEGHNNNLIMPKLDAKSLKLRAKNDEHFEFRLKNLISITYISRDDEPRKVFFLDRKLVSESDVGNLIGKHWVSSPIELTTATVESILSRAKELTSVK